MGKRFYQYIIQLFVEKVNNAVEVNVYIFLLIWYNSLKLNAEAAVRTVLEDGSEKTEEQGGQNAYTYRNGNDKNGTSVAPQV